MPSLTGGLTEISHESTQLSGGTQALLMRIYSTQKPCETLNKSTRVQCLAVTRLLLRYAYFIAGFLYRLIEAGANQALFAMRLSYLARSSS